ncbi:MAG: TlpA family protein disulfide reductase [Candidatus Amulumruptor caecigallinarius]|nr:TlpA family protein disulfide reductase [Candidatus Amulumruptor caecigallinarius]
MMMRNRIIPLLMIGSLCFASCRKEGKLSMQLPEKFEGAKVEMIDYLDSTIIASQPVRDGKVEFVLTESDSVKFPRFTMLVVDGRVNAYYIAEPGGGFVTDSTSFATGTPLNDRLSEVMTELDSVENMDDMNLYVKFVEKKYNENRNNVISGFLGIEWLKYANPEKIDSMLTHADTHLKNSRRAKYYINMAGHRLATAPGKKYVDLSGEDSLGAPVSLSKYVVPGKYNIIDFWASWCPYCIRELPELKDLAADYADKLNIIGVAVRDIPEDTRRMVRKQRITWPVIYNTKRVPYDKYGFAGIPHHILIAPDGTIISRGENVAQLRERIKNLSTN